MVATAGRARWPSGATELAGGVGQQECLGSCAVRRQRRWEGSIRVTLSPPGGPNVLRLITFYNSTSVVDTQPTS